LAFSKEKFGLYFGPILAITLLFFFDLDPDNPLVTRAAAVTLLMACWWITEAIPIPATALLPVALFPLLGILSGKQVSSAYFNDVIFLFIGGFIMALAMQRWQLHRRIALKIIMLIGVGQRRILFGFMAATAILSMWISNTATTMMMVPIALSIILKLKENYDPEKVSKLSIGLLLSIAYAASIGGVATLIGTPPNLAFARIYTISFPDAPEITFAQWMLFGVPYSIIFLVITWWLLSRKYAHKLIRLEPEVELFEKEYNSLGKTTFEEKTVMAFFFSLVILWLTRSPINFGLFTSPGWSILFPDHSFINDGTVAITIALILFLIPSRSNVGERIMNWQTAVKLDWGVVILFGGGFALAQGMETSGLSNWFGEHLTGLKGIPMVLTVLVVCLSLSFLSELASNTASAQMALPLIASLAIAVSVHPLFLMVPATLAASSGFMLPVATPPNAIVFGSGQIQMPDMVRAGLKLNFIGAGLITVLIYLLGDFAFGIN
jgi:sodium-dependent dicarboxylate transporter 2/3/5